VGRTSAVPAAPPVAASTASSARAAYAKLPLAFEANLGQTNRRVKFVARGPGYSLFLTPRESVLVLRARAPSARGTSRSVPRGRAAYARTGVATVVMRLVRSNRRRLLVGRDKLPGQTNYMLGRNPDAWRTGLPSYASAFSRGVYPGVDLLYHGRQGQLEYDFHVAPGADPGRIVLAFSGAQRLSLDQGGNLVLTTGAGVLREDRPSVYQQVGGHRHAVSGRFVLRPGHRVGFRLGPYDRGRPLVIDPALVYSTMLGGSLGGNFGDVIAVDSSGATYIAGAAAAVNFPITSGAFQTTRAGDPTSNFSADAFVTKLNPTGTGLVYSTFIGGRFQDQANSIAVDASGRAYVTGNTGSPDFPTTPGAYQATAPAGGNQDAFVSVLNPSGSALDYSTYLGATTSYSASNGIAVDSSQHAYVTGYTAATDFPTTSGAFQTALPTTSGSNNAFVTKLDPSAAGGASLVYSTFLGGSAFDTGNAIVVDSAGAAYVGGYTGSSDFPTKNAFQSAPAASLTGFVTKLNPGGSALDYSTYLGGSGQNTIAALALDSAGHAYVTGSTASTDFPTTAGAFQPHHAGNPAVDGTNDAFVTKLDPSASGASSLLYSSYLGGTGEDDGNAIAVAPDGSIVVGGEADNTGQVRVPAATFPTADPLAPLAAFGDAFVSVVKPDGSGLSFSTYLGGGSEDSVDGIALDSSGSIYVAGSATSTDFPTLNAFQAQNLDHGSVDYRETFVTKIAPVDPAAPLVTGLDRRSGPAGTPLVITGHGFADASVVRFGAVAASSFTVDSDRQIEALAPSGVPGEVAVTVTTPQGTSPPNPIADFLYAQGTWDLTGSLNVARLQGQTATRLSDGRVLVAGGLDIDFSVLAAAEVYDPATGKWTSIQPMGTARSQATATLLRGGKVLVSGGQGQNGEPVATAELYDPATGTWSPTGSMTDARADHTATVLPDGKVLVAGGNGPCCGGPLASAEFYDPATGAWSPAGTLGDARAEHTATLLSNGTVLVVGGNGANAPLASAELYDPATNSWSTTGPLNTARANPITAALPNGRVLVAGGRGRLGALSSTEIYDLASGEFGPTGAMTANRSGPAVAALADGRVLVAGGSEGNIMNYDTTEIYDPATGQWIGAGLMNRYRSFFNAGAMVFSVALADGKVLVGGDGQDAGATTELYIPSAPSAPSSPSSGSGPGSSPGPPPGSGVSLVPPLVTHFALTNNPFVVGGTHTPMTGFAAAARRHKRGTTFTYTLSEAATVKIVIMQRLAERRLGNRCVATAKKTPAARRCTRMLTRGTLTRTSHSGVNRIPFSGRIGARALKASKYHARLTATDANKRSSKPESLAFTIVSR
jgi:hypothetical protein